MVQKLKSAASAATKGMVYFMKDESHYLAIANELSSTVSLYRLKQNCMAVKLTSLKVGSFIVNLKSFTTLSCLHS